MMLVFVFFAFILGLVRGTASQSSYIAAVVQHETFYDSNANAQSLLSANLKIYEEHIILAASKGTQIIGRRSNL